MNLNRICLSYVLGASLYAAQEYIAMYLLKCVMKWKCVCVYIILLFNLRLVISARRGQRVVSFIRVVQTRKSCVPCSSLEADNIHTNTRTTLAWQMVGDICVFVCVCVRRAAGVKERLFKLWSPNYANENRVRIGARQLSKNTDRDTIWRMTKAWILHRKFDWMPICVSTG